MPEKLITLINNHGMEIFVSIFACVFPYFLIYRFDEMTPPGLPTVLFFKEKEKMEITLPPRRS
jgi:hypothetical protein